jgi:hypothetical protein
MDNGQRDELKRLTGMLAGALDRNQNQKPWTYARFIGAVRQVSHLVANVCKDTADMKGA